MDMGRVVPGRGQCGGVAVEDDASPYEDQAVDVALDGAELVRAEEDRDAELAMELLEKRRKGLLCIHVDSRPDVKIRFDMR